MKKGDKLICKNNIIDNTGNIIFEKSREYEVLYLDNEKPKIMVIIKTDLQKNGIFEQTLDWVHINFKLK